MTAAGISAIAACIAALAAVLGILRSMRNGAAIQEVHLSINSRLDQLLNATAAKSHSEGKAEGIAEAAIAKRRE